ncbi:Putative peroxiredoxin (Fragment) OS=Malassezia furfur PE=1 SV=1 [Rhizoctonia solani AG-1 IB]|uniref:Putative peroxiredoxin n=1 Tax=Thanatephorus cucumeris (strain AG1-IB / isolate 7/3/14) TaxID=1108050 RepID=A0A0B7FEQ9_THACB
MSDTTKPVEVIKVGATIPEAEFPTVYWSEELENGAACGVPSKLSTKSWAGKKVVVVAVPGAFTPTCHVNHIPAYIKNYQAFKDKGVDQIVVIAANDQFVMSGWGRINGAKDHVLFVSDTYAEWSKKLGLGIDLTAHGLGERTGRYALVLKDNKVETINVEPNPGAVSNTGAEHILAAL